MGMGEQLLIGRLPVCSCSRHVTSLLRASQFQPMQYDKAMSRMRFTDSSQDFVDDIMTAKSTT
jgi:hypothetical protein